MKSCTKIYYIGYVTVKGLKYEKINSEIVCTLLSTKWMDTLKKLIKMSILRWFLLMRAKKKLKNIKNCGVKSKIWLSSRNLDLLWVQQSDGASFWENYIKLYFDAKHLKKWLDMGRWNFWCPFFEKNCCPFWQISDTALIFKIRPRLDQWLKTQMIMMINIWKSNLFRMTSYLQIKR